jgi:hypothetical protein
MSVILKKRGSVVVNDHVNIGKHIVANSHYLRLEPTFVCVCVCVFVCVCVC